MSWSQLGSDISGLVQWDKIGMNYSMNSDGTRIAYCAIGKIYIK